MSGNPILSQILLVTGKELMDMLRDYKALVPGVLLGLMLGPLLTCFAPQMVVGQVQKAAQESLHVALVGDGGVLYKMLRSNPGLKIVPLSFETAGSSGAVNDYSQEQLLKELEQEKVQVIVQAPSGFSASLEGFAAGAPGQTVKPELKILYTGRNPESSYAGIRMLSVLNSSKEKFMDERIKVAGIKVEEAPVLDMKVVSPPADGPFASPFLARVLSSILVFVAFIGAIYPAIDLLTGERERGTLEPLVITPVSRRCLFAGKLVSVTCISYMFVIANLIGFYVSQFFQPPLLDILPFPLAAKLPLLCAVWAALLMLPLCLSLAVSMLALAGMARTVQQAQGYFTSLMFVAMLPMGLGLSGDVHLNLPLSLVPFLGSLVTINDILEARYNPALMGLSIVVSLLFTVLLVLVAAPTMEREDLMFGVEEAPARRYEAGKFGRELFLLCSAVFLLMFYLSQSLVVMHHIWGLLLTQIMVVFAPAFMLVYFWLKLPVKTVFGLEKPSGGFVSCLGAALTAPLTFVAALAVAHLQSQFLPSSKALEKLMEQILGLGHEPLWLLLLIVALSPGICEELLFRGLIFSLLRKRLRQGQLILAVGALFGLFHMSVMRFLPTAILGMLLTFIRLRSRSIYPCMCLHAAHNGMAVLLASHFKADLPAHYLVIAGLTGLCGLSIFLWSTRKA
ncbi:MAG TPA: CPBP family glutamic-type intramembrane protease [Candidatus Obscuribacter sp.]|nr:CPBP family glutamic-type intramembrane protease [Candidatus Obscuribacter sp.]